MISLRATLGLMGSLAVASSGFAADVLVEDFNGDYVWDADLIEQNWRRAFWNGTWWRETDRLTSPSNAQKFKIMAAETVLPGDSAIQYGSGEDAFSLEDFAPDIDPTKPWSLTCNVYGHNDSASPDEPPGSWWCEFHVGGFTEVESKEYARVYWTSENNDTWQQLTFHTEGSTDGETQGNLILAVHWGAEAVPVRSESYVIFDDIWLTYTLTVRDTDAPGPETDLAAKRPDSGAEDTPRPFIFGLGNPGTSDEALRAVKAAGCTNIRIGGNWDLVESTPGVYDFSHGGDEEVRFCRKHGLEPFFLIVATPPWALSPEKRGKPWGWPAERQFYPQAAQFYRMLAARYRGQVRYYEFWNEENGYGWHDVNKPEEYAPILKVAYTALKEGNPDCVVAIGGLDGSGWKGYTQYLERLYELGCGDYFDAVAVHPYREDGPIDVHSLKRIHDILVRHGHGDRKLWLTEYGWSNEYGHDNKARWLKESLDLLSSPEYDFVFQASYHTLQDFSEAEYGLCDAEGNPRAAYQVFRDYPKDWSVMAERRKAPAPASAVSIPNGDFEEEDFPWTPYGDGMAIVRAKKFGIPPEEEWRVLAVPLGGGPHNGGVYLRVAVPEGVPIRLSARVFTNQQAHDPDNSRCRVGIDPTGGIDPRAKSIVWGRTIATSGAWDSTGVGQGDPILPQADHVTLFLEYMQKGGDVHQVSAFDQVLLEVRPDTFELPEVQPIPGRG